MVTVDDVKYVYEVVGIRGDVSSVDPKGLLDLGAEILAKSDHGYDYDYEVEVDGSVVGTIQLRKRPCRALTLTLDEGEG